MTNDEIKKINRLAEKIGSGTREETNAAYNELRSMYSKELPLILNKFIKMENYSLDQDDLFQIAEMTMFETALRWNDSSRGIDFVNYVNYAIRATLTRITSEDAPIRVPYATQRNKRNNIKKRKGHEKESVASIDHLKNCDDHFEIGKTPSSLDIVLEQEKIEQVHEAISNLPYDQKSVLCRRFGIQIGTDQFTGEAETLEKIAQADHISKQAVMGKQKRAVENVKKLLETMNFEYV